MLFSCYFLFWSTVYSRRQHWQHASVQSKSKCKNYKLMENIYQWGDVTTSENFPLNLLLLTSVSVTLTLHPLSINGMLYILQGSIFSNADTFSSPPCYISWSCVLHVISIHGTLYLSPACHTRCSLICLTWAAKHCWPLDEFRLKIAWLSLG